MRFRSGFLIYLAVMVFALGLGGFGAATLSSAIQRAQDAASVSHLQMEAADFQSRRVAVSSLLARAYQKLRSQKIVSVSEPLDSADRLAIYQAKCAMEETFNSISYDDVSDIMLYFTQSRLAILPTTVYAIDNLATLYFKTDPNQLLDLFEDFLASGLSQSLHVLEVNQRHFHLLFRRFNITGSQEKIIGITILDKKMFDFHPINNAHLYIASSDGLCYDENGLLSTWPVYSQLRTEASTHTMDGNTYHMISASIAPGYRLVAAIPEEDYHRSAYLMAMLGHLASAAIGLVVCLILHSVRRRYNQNLNEIGQLLRLPPEKRMLRPGGIEFEQIYQSLTHLIHQNDDLLHQNEVVQKQVESSRTLMRNSFIRMLMQGKVDEGELDNMLSFYGIDACYDRYRVLLLQLESRGLTIEEADHARQVLLTAASSIMDCTCETCIVDDYTVGLLYMCNLDQKSETDDKVRQYAAHIIEVMRQKLDLHVSVGLGRSVKDIGNCLYAYHSARMVLICSSRSGLKGLILGDTLSEEDSGHLMHIIHALLQGDTQQCLGAFDVMFSPVDEDSNHTARQRTNAIVLFNLFDDTVNGNAQLKKLFAGDEGFNQLLSQCFTLGDILKLIRSTLERACLHIASTSEDRGKLLIDHAVQLIQQRYTDASLSQTEIAEILGINAATLSTRFKEIVGVNMSAYIRNLRIERAKVLLMDKSLSIDAVAEQTGFGSLKTMYRIFKTETGATPGQHRGEMC